MKCTPRADSYRIGHGYDLHRLEPFAANGDSNEKGARPLVLCGVPLNHDLGPVGHSDGDAALHALTDGLLGAVGEPDIGELFPNSSPKWKNADSAIFLREAVARVGAAGYEIANVDLTIILERPKISPFKDAMRMRVAELLGIPSARINIKGKTHEKVDAVGEGRAVEAHAVVLVARNSTAE